MFYFFLLKFNIFMLLIEQQDGHLAYNKLATAIQNCFDFLDASSV